MEMLKGFYFRGPAHVDFNLTNGCNLACSHCHSSSGKKLEDELDTEQVFKVIAGLHQLGVASIAFAGGEPFLRKDIIDILAYASLFHGWNISVITNGFYCQEAILQNILLRCPNIVINISLDGSRAEKFSILRKQKKGHKPEFLFTRVTDGIRNVIASGIRSSVNFTITKATIADLIPCYQFVIEELEASNFVGIKFFPGGYGKEHLDRYELPYPLWSKHFANWTRRKLQGELGNMQISVPSAWEFYLPLIEQDIDVKKVEQMWHYRSPLREKIFQQNRNIADVAGIAELCIHGDGKVYPSVLLSGIDKMVCGNVKDLEIGEIWHNSLLLQRIRQMTVTELGGGCSQCRFKSICGGGSRSRAFSLHETLFSADSNCPILPDKASLVVEGKFKVNLNDESIHYQCNMFVLGSGEAAIRFFFDQKNCEIRYEKYILHCNEDLSEKLRKLRNIGKINSYFSSIFSEKIENLYNKFQFKLDELASYTHVN